MRNFIGTFGSLSVVALVSMAPTASQAKALFSPFTGAFKGNYEDLCEIRKIRKNQLNLLRQREDFPELLRYTLENCPGFGNLLADGAVATIAGDDDDRGDNGTGGGGNGGGGGGGGEGGGGGNGGGGGGNGGDVDGPGKNVGGPGKNVGGPGKNEGGPGKNTGGPGKNEGGPGKNEGGSGDVDGPGANNGGI
ncbi:MAG: hypothetical protein ACKVPY_13620 [Paracoccaceae bacterium]